LSAKTVSHTGNVEISPSYVGVGVVEKVESNVNGIVLIIEEFHGCIPGILECHRELQKFTSPVDSSWEAGELTVENLFLAYNETVGDERIVQCDNAI
jgi:hypothetical protein